MAHQEFNHTPTRMNGRRDRGASASLSSPKMSAARNDRTPTRRNPRPMVGNLGEVVSDEDQGTDGDDEAADGVGQEDHDMLEPDDFALPGANTTPHQAGRSSQPSAPSCERRQSTTSMPTPSEASQDDNYDEVDVLSDGGESDFDPVAEEALLKESERDLIKEFKQIERRADQRRDPALSRNLLLSPDFAAVEPTIDFAKDPFLGLSLTDPNHRAMLAEAEDDLAAWRLPNPIAGPPALEQAENTVRESASASDEPSTSDRIGKRVRFRRASSVSSDEDPAEAFPDLMDSVTPGGPFPLALFSDPAPALEYESSEDSADDFGYSMTFSTNLQGDSFSGDSDSDEDSSESDTEDGDTTDEEMDGDEAEREEYIRAARAKLNLKSVSSDTPSTPEPNKRPASASTSRSMSISSAKTTKGSNSQPKARIFPHDPSRAALSLGKDGVKLQSPSNPPEKDREFWDRARRAMGKSAAGSGGSVSWTRSESRAAKAPPKPFTCNQTLGNIFDGNLPVPESVLETPTTALTSFVDVMHVDQWDNDSSATEDHDFMDDDSQDEHNFNMNELIDFGLCTNDADGNRPVSAGVFSQHSEHIPVSSPTATTPDWDEAGFAPELDADGQILSHLSQQPNLVASFRINQDRARAVGSLAINPIQRAETSERNAIQSSRRGAENLPFSPARRSRLSQDLTGAGVTKSPRTHGRGRGSSIAQNPAAAAELQKMLAGIQPSTPSR